MRELRTFEQTRLPPPAVVRRPRRVRERDVVAQVANPVEVTFNTVGFLALVAAGLHSLGWFLDVCSLTWASMVVLGGLVTYLRRTDFIISAVLLLMEATRFVTAVSIMHFFTNHTFHIQSKSLNIFLRMVVPAAQLLINCVPSFTLAFSALRVLRHSQPYHDYETLPDLRFNVITTSLSVLYFLVLINASVSAACLLYSIVVSLGLLHFSGDVEDESLQKYYDEILWRGVHDGVISATIKTSLLTFAFEAQAMAYAAGMEPHELILVRFRKLIKYLYDSPMGMECACVYLDSPDTYSQLAAARLVGYWTRIGDKFNQLVRKRSRFRSRLLSKLADKIDMGQTGWAATISFRLLAKLSPDLVLNTVSEVGKRNVASILSEGIGRADSWSVSCMLAILPLLPLLRENRPAAVSEQDLNMLETNLRKILRNEAMWVAERVTAAMALFTLKGAEALTQADKDVLNTMRGDPRDFYISPEQKNYFVEILGYVPPECDKIPIIVEFGPDRYISVECVRPHVAIAAGVLVCIVLGVCGCFIARWLLRVAS